MSYIGVEPKSGFIKADQEKITGQTTNYVNLTNSISTLDDVQIWVNYVIQDPSTLTLNSTTQVGLGGTLVSGDVVLVTYLGQSVATQSPPVGGVSNDMLVNSSITLNGSAVSLGGSASVDNTPYFEAKMSATQTLTDATWTKLNFNTEVFDSASAYDTSTYRFTPQTAGKYLCYVMIFFDAQGVDKFHRTYGNIYKNGSSYKESGFDNYDNYFLYATTNTFSTIIDFNGSSDYIEAYGYFDVTSGTGQINSNTNSIFGGYKLIT